MIGSVCVRTSLGRFELHTLNGVHERRALKTHSSVESCSSETACACIQESEEAVSREMEELCAQVAAAVSMAAGAREAAECKIAELQRLLHVARADAAQVCCAACCVV